MGIHDYQWQDLPKELAFKANDIVTFMCEKLHENDDPNRPQMILECRIVTSEKSEDYVGEKVNLYFPFKTKQGTSNKNTFKFLQLFFKEEMATRKSIPYEKLVGKIFTAISDISTYEGKDYLKWDKYQVIGDAESQEF